MSHRILALSSTAALGLLLLGGSPGFAPSTLSEAAAQQLPPAPERAQAVVFPSSRGWLGLHLSYEVARSYGAAGVRPPEAPVPDDDARVRIVRVADDGPADRAGVRAGDLLVEIAGRPANLSSVQEITRNLRPGDEVELQLQRNGEPRTIRVVAGERPPLFLAEGVLVSPDSVRHLVRMHMDSLQVRIDSVRRLGSFGITPSRPDGLTPPRVGLEAPRGVLSLRGSLPEGAPRAPAPIAALIVGQRVLAGAEFTSLNPALGSYFGVEEGVLTLDVVEGSPAYRGGLRAGDVVLQVGETEVRSLSELRDELARAFRDPPVHLSVLREGERRTLQIPR
jgi:membrane-associated protease RseP (regulator of RpoE activity)